MTGSQPAANHIRRGWRRASLMTVAVGVGVTATASAQVTTKGRGPVAPGPMSTVGLAVLFKPTPGSPLAATKPWVAPPLMRSPSAPFEPYKQWVSPQLVAAPVNPLNPLKPVEPPKAIIPPKIEPLALASAPLKPVEPPKPAASTPVAVKPTAPTPVITPVIPPPSAPLVVAAKPTAAPPTATAKHSTTAPETSAKPAPLLSAPVVTPPAVVAAGNNEPTKPAAAPPVAWPEPALAQKVIGGQTAPPPPVKLPEPGSLAASPKGEPGMKVALQPVPMPQPPAGGGVERARQVEQPRPPVAQPGPAAPGVGAPGGAGQPVEQLGPPRPFLDDRPRLGRMGNGPVGTTPVPTEKDLAEFGQFIDKVIDPKNTLDVIEGRARLLILKKEPTQYQLVDPTLVSANQLSDPKQFSVLGRRTGSTVLNLWFTDPANPKEEKILSYLVRVLPDPEQKARLERVYRALEDEINRYFPNSRVRLTLVGDKLMVSGQAHDIYDSSQILRILRANAPTTGGGPARPPVNTVGATGGNPFDPTNPTGTPGQESYILEGGPNVINNLRIPGDQQVMLRVTVAEVNRAAARSIGVNFSVVNNRGITVFNQLTGGINGQGNLVVNLDNGQVPIAINALRTLNYARSLAEPNLTALNGQTATFLAGGQFPVPVLGGFGQFGGGNGLQGVQFVPFGVQLSFTPLITDRDRVRLNLQATVSTRDNNAGTNIGGSNVPGLNSRTFSTTVEMREGQTMAVAGLIQTNSAAESNRVPFLGDLPYLGRLLGLDRMQYGEQELVVLITPELVHPLNPNELTPLPGSDIYEPGDLEFYLKGRLESRRSYDYRSAVRTDIDRMLSYRRCEQQFITGPTGHMEGVFNRPVTAPAAGK